MKKGSARTGQLRPAPGQDKQKDQRVPEWTRDSGKIIVVPVELSPAAHALLRAFALHQGYTSVAEYFLELAVSDAGNANQFADAIFAENGKEVA